MYLLNEFVKVLRTIHVAWLICEKHGAPALGTEEFSC